MNDYDVATGNRRGSIHETSVGTQSGANNIHRSITIHDS